MMVQYALVLACVLAFAAAIATECHASVRHDSMHGTAVRGLQQITYTARTRNMGVMSTLAWPVPAGYT
jgi:hypothetical protein